MTKHLPAHSPRGASSAERWMNCPGSTILLSRLELPDTDEPDYRKEGVALHEAAAHCLVNRRDAWEVVSETFYGIKLDGAMAGAIQVYLDAVAPEILEADFFGIEEKFHNPEVHADFYGTADCWWLKGGLLCLTDLKGGEGIVVDPENNAQCLYYAYDKVLKFPKVERVLLRIVQPRAFHSRGPVREWEVSADFVRTWAEKELLPAMRAADVDGTLIPGEWCRFCPAKTACPALHALYKAAATCDPAIIPDLSDTMLGLNYQVIPAVKMLIAAIEDEVYKRLTAGHAVEGCKLVSKRANRVWTEEARPILVEVFADKALKEPELKTPAQVEKLGPQGKELAAKYAYTPQTGLTVALDADPRHAVKLESPGETFAHITNASNQGEKP